MNKVICLQVRRPQQRVSEWLLNARQCFGIARVEVVLMLSLIAWYILNVHTILSTVASWVESGPKLSASSLVVLLSVQAALLLGVFFAKSILSYEEAAREADGWILTLDELEQYAMDMVSTCRARVAICASFVVMLSLVAPTADHFFFVFGVFPLIALCAAGLLWYSMIAKRMGADLHHGLIFENGQLEIAPELNPSSLRSGNPGRGETMSVKCR